MSSEEPRREAEDCKKRRWISEERPQAWEPELSLDNSMLPDS